LNVKRKHFAWNIVYNSTIANILVCDPLKLYVSKKDITYSKSVLKRGVPFKLNMLTAVATIKTTATEIMKATAAVVTLTALAIQIPATAITIIVAEMKVTAVATARPTSPVSRHSIWRRDHAIEQRPKIRTRKQTRSSGNS
jgi:hypothetical protein